MTHIKDKVDQTTKGSRMIFLLAFSIIISLYIFFGYLNKGWLFGNDAQNYYMVARSLYFDKDIDFTNEWHLTPHPEHLGEPRKTITGKIANRYPIGYALLSQPFFLISDVLTVFSNGFLKLNLPNDGYRGIYGILIPLSSLFYAYLGIYLSYKIILRFFSKKIAVLSINTIILSTSLLWYITGHLTMSHAYSFAVVTALIYVSIPFHYKRLSDISIVRCIITGALISLAVMVRLQNIVFVFIPLLAISASLLKQVNRNNIKSNSVKLGIRVIILFFSALTIFIPQMIFWKIIFGSYLVNSYSATIGTVFYFNTFHPELLKTLFSTNHGLFLWHPITLIACLGVILLFLRIRESRLLLLSLSMCFLMTWYIIASGDYSLSNSFGNRGFDGFTLFFALGFAEILNHLQRRGRMPIFLCLFFILWNIQLMMQQRYLGWLPYGGEVSYSQVFTNYENLPSALDKIRSKYLP